MCVQSKLAYEAKHVSSGRQAMICHGLPCPQHPDMTRTQRRAALHVILNAAFGLGGKTKSGKRERGTYLHVRSSHDFGTRLSASSGIGVHQVERSSVKARLYTRHGGRQLCTLLCHSSRHPQNTCRGAVCAKQLQQWQSKTGSRSSDGSREITTLHTTCQPPPPQRHSCAALFHADRHTNRGGGWGDTVIT